MSSSRGSAGAGRNAVNGKGNSGGGVGSIPQASKKIVQSLKEIVNCPELEIYAMLKECNMDPNEAVNRLLSQDPFHEVKSKKEKKKEYKDATDSRSRGGSSTLNRGARGSNDRYGRAILSQFSSSDAGTSRAKPSQKKDSGAPYTGSSSVPVMSGSNVNWPPTSVSEATVESKPLTGGASEVIPSLNPPSGFQSVWSGVPGQLSMADIVKMGRPHGRASSNVNPSEQIVNHQHAVASQIVPTHGLSTSENYAAKASEFNSKSGVAGSQQLPPNDGWPQVEQQTASLTAKSEPPVFSVYEEPFTMPFERTNHHLDNAQSEENAEIGDHLSLVSSRKMQDESSANPSVFNDNYHNINSYQVHRPAFDQQEVEDASVSAINIQQLSLSKEEEEEEEEEQDKEDEVEEEDFPKEADSPAVKIPEHLQVQSIDCSHLSFGSFASAINAPFSQTFASGPEKSNIEETSVTADAALVGHTDTRNVEYYDDEHLRTVSDGDIGQRLAASAGGYDMPSASQSETLKQETVEVAPGNQYSFPPSGSTFENSQQLNPSFSHSQTSSQMQNLPPFSGVMAYSDSLPSSLLQSNVQPIRDAELPYSPFPTAQSMPGKYTGSIPGPTNSMTEAMKTGNMASPQPEQNLPGSSIAGAPGFPHLAMHPYSQPSLPFANMIGYPFLPQSYTYMPSAFQQAIAAAGNSTYHQSLAAAAAAHPQYKNNVSGSNMPQSAAIPSGYGAFGSSTNVPGNFQLNPSQPPAAPSATSMSYEELLNSQYKDAAHLLALQQGLGSRTMSAVPASAYYSLQGQTQQPAGYRQTQQLPSQHYSNVGGYPNFYHSQAGLSLEAQQQMSRDQSLGGSQGQQQPKQPQQMWPNGY